MATSEPINIQIDAEALRKQVQGVIQEELREMSMRLRRAADALHPEFMSEHNAHMEIYFRTKWEAEHAEQGGETR